MIGGFGLPGWFVVADFLVSFLGWIGLGVLAGPRAEFGALGMVDVVGYDVNGRMWVGIAWHFA